MIHQSIFYFKCQLFGEQLDDRKSSIGVVYVTSPTLVDFTILCVVQYSKYSERKKQTVVANNADKDKQDQLSFMTENKGPHTNTTIAAQRFESQSQGRDGVTMRCLWHVMKKKQCYRGL